MLFTLARSAEYLVSIFPNIVVFKSGGSLLPEEAFATQCQESTRKGVSPNSLLL